MLKLFFILICFFNLSYSFGQVKDNVWIYGTVGAYLDPTVKLIHPNFNQDTAYLLTQNLRSQRSPVIGYGTDTVACIFSMVYGHIFNKDFELIKSESITHGSLYDLVLGPSLEDKDELIAFWAIPELINNQNYITIKYSIFDTRLDGGKGDIDTLRHGKIIDRIPIDSSRINLHHFGYDVIPLTLLRSADSSGYWLTLPYQQSNTMHWNAYSIDCKGIDTIPVTSPAGNSFLGYSVTKNQEHDFIIIGGDSASTYFDFNQLTGEFNNQRRLGHYWMVDSLAYANYLNKSAFVLPNYGHVSCVGLSPNDSILYLSRVGVASGFLLTSIDLYAPSPTLTEDTVYYHEGSSGRYGYNGRFGVRKFVHALDGNFYASMQVQYVFENASGWPISADSFHIILNPNSLQNSSLAINFAPSVHPSAPLYWTQKSYTNGTMSLSRHQEGVWFNRDRSYSTFQDISVCKNNSTLINGNKIPGYQYTWKPGLFLSDSTIANPLVTTDSNITYEVIANNGSCIDTFQVSVSILFEPNLSIIDTTIICKNDSVFVKHKNGIPYLWERNGVDLGLVGQAEAYFSKPGNYKIYTQDSTSTCLDSLLFTLSSGLTLPDTIFCLDSLNQIPNLINGPVHSVKWSPSFGLSSDSVSQPFVLFKGVQSYQSIINDGICIDTSIITIGSDHQINANISGDTSVCKGNTILLNHDQKLLNQLWFNSTPIDSLKAKYLLSNQGKYHLISTNKFTGCSDTTSLRIIHPPVLAGMQIFGDSNQIPATLTFSNNTPYELVKWITHNDQELTGENVTLNIEQAGKYLIKQIVRNSFGCLDTMVKTFTVFPNTCVFVPNAISSNQDGTNDIFRPITTCPYRQITIKIYNRWGQLIYSGQDEWVPINIQMGVYMYIIEFQGIDNSVFLNGNITILK